jgi:hypothetical protein
MTFFGAESLDVASGQTARICGAPDSQRGGLADTRMTERNKHRQCMQRCGLFLLMVSFVLAGASLFFCIFGA